MKALGDHLVQLPCFKMKKLRPPSRDERGCSRSSSETAAALGLVLQPQFPSCVLCTVAQSSGRSHTSIARPLAVTVCLLYMRQRQQLQKCSSNQVGENCTPY